jgi:hypothetical protein
MGFFGVQGGYSYTPHGVGGRVYDFYDYMFMIDNDDTSIFFLHKQVGLHLTISVIDT